VVQRPCCPPPAPRSDGAAAGDPAPAVRDGLAPRSSSIRGVGAGEGARRRRRASRPVTHDGVSRRRGTGLRPATSAVCRPDRCGVLSSVGLAEAGGPAGRR
jgi:hypothetical protein